MAIAAEICVYTNDNLVIEKLDQLMTNDFSPARDRLRARPHIVGQHDAKRAVAVALRNRWRRQQLPEALRDEVLPKNILMIGPTGCGKTEIAAAWPSSPTRRSSRSRRPSSPRSAMSAATSSRSPATWWKSAIEMTRERLRKDVKAKAELAAEERVLDALCGAERQRGDQAALPPQAARRRARTTARSRSRSPIPAAPMPFEIPGLPGASVGMINIGDMMGKAFGGRTKKRKMTVAESHEALMREESDKLLDQEKVIREALEMAEQNGIVFLDEIDKITARSEFRGGGDVSREGVQRDLLPLIEGTTVAPSTGR